MRKNKKKSILDRIKPVVLVKNIFKYVKDNNLILKLLNYSKYFQKKLNIQLIDYQVSYIKGINLNDYLTFKTNYKENELKKKFEDFLLKNNIDIGSIDIQKFTIKLFEKNIQFHKKKITNCIDN